MRPYSPLELVGRNIYVREGCYSATPQMIRPLRDEVERYGHYSLAAESMYDHPFQWGSKRTGPDLARVGGKYSNEWHVAHLRDPRAVVPEIDHAGLCLPCGTHQSNANGVAAHFACQPGRRRALQRRDDRRKRRRSAGSRPIRTPTRPGCCGDIPALSQAVPAAACRSPKWMRWWPISGLGTQVKFREVSPDALRQ